MHYSIQEYRSVDYIRLADVLSHQATKGAAARASIELDQDLISGIRVC